VMALLLPLNPLTHIRRAAGPALDVIARGLRDCATALEMASREAAEAALTRLREDRSIAAFRDALSGARETAALAPVRWRSRGPLNQYLDSAEHLDHAVRNCRVLARRTVALLRDEEAVPDGLVDALSTVAEAVTPLRDELAAGVEPSRSRELALDAVRAAAAVYRAGVGFSGGVVIAQIRTIGTDLLLASGLPRPVVEKAVRRAVGRISTR